MTTLYYYAEQHNFSVIGTANKNEHSQGFFVKYGDGGTDIQPISHLLKTQVYQLAAYLDIPEEIQRRTPTTDTYSAHQTQEEFFFRMPFETMDLLWYAYEHEIAAAAAAQVVGLSEVQVQRVFSDFQRKQRSTSYLRLAPVSVQKEISSEENSLDEAEPLKLGQDRLESAQSAAGSHNFPDASVAPIRARNTEC